MPERLAPFGFALIAAALAAFPLAAAFDRALGPASSSGIAFGVFLAVLAAIANLLGWWVGRLASARAAVVVFAILALAGAVVIALTAPPDALAQYASVVAGLAVLIAAPFAVAWSRRRFAGTPRGRSGLRAAGALGAATVAAYFTLAWAPFLIDAFVDVATPLGWSLTALAFALACAAAMYAVWNARDARSATASALVVAGMPGALGPFLLYALRASALARPSAAIRADWNEQNALMGVIVVGTLALMAGVMAVIGAALLARRPARAA